MIHQFESGRRLHILYTIAETLKWFSAIVFVFALSACGDGRKPDPSPSPKGLKRWSSTEYIAWKGPQDPVLKPIALVIDRTNGPLDQICADGDVTSFLNDRFHPIFIHTHIMPTLDAALILISPDGEPLGGPLAPPDADAWIQLGNQLMRQERLPTKTWTCDNLNSYFQEGHPLLKACEPTK